MQKRGQYPKAECVISEVRRVSWYPGILVSRCLHGGAVDIWLHVGVIIHDNNA